MGLPELTSDINDMAGSSPKTIAAVSVLRLYEKFFDYMSINPNVNVERMTAALLISCPEKAIRERMWKLYLKERDAPGGGEVNAAIYAAGEWYEYMSNAMGLNEKSTGAG
jgi:hypothetical protein